MSDWDASSADEATSKAVKPTPTHISAAAAGRRRFDDEEDEVDEVQDDWEASEEEAPKAAATKPAATAVPPTKKKMSFKQKIAQKEEEERRRAEMGFDDDDDEVDPLDADPIARKRREMEAQIDADVENAASLLGVASVSKADSTTSSLAKAKPTTKEAYEALALQIYTEILQPQHSRDSAAFAKHLVPALTRHMVKPLRDVDARKLSTNVKTWADEKTKGKAGGAGAGSSNSAVSAAAAKAKSSAPAAAGKKGKPSLAGAGSAKDTWDLGTYGDEVLDDGDDLDFM